MLLIASFGMSGCMSGPQLTPLQQRVMQSKELEGTYEDAFRSTMAILQDKQYIASTSDYAGGVIMAKTPRLPSSWGCTKENEMSINVERFTESITKIRVSIYAYFYSMAGVRLTDKYNNQILGGSGNGPLVQDPKIYQDFYAEIQKEMFRRAQLNK